MNAGKISPTYVLDGALMELNHPDHSQHSYVSAVVCNIQTHVKFNYCELPCEIYALLGYHSPFLQLCVPIQLDSNYYARYNEKALKCKPSALIFGHGRAKKSIALQGSYNIGIHVKIM